MKLTKQQLNLIKEISEMPRYLVSSGYDESLMLIKDYAIKQKLEVHIHKYKTGYDAGTWVVPKRWELVKGCIKNSSGDIILDSREDPLCVISSSLPISKKVSRKVLKQHLTYFDYAPDAIPFVFKYYKRDWGFSCNKSFYDNLDDDEYYVEIQTIECDGELKVLEISSSGRFDETFLFSSHLCHPYQINDGPLAVIPVINLLAELNKKSNYSYKLLVVPEQIGSACWISNNQDKVKKIISGMFIEMIGTDLPIRLNKSWDGNTIFDKFFSNKLKNLDKDGIVDDFVFANDERQFNGPGVRIPMLGLNRSLMSRYEKDGHAFNNYHTSEDNFININFEKFFLSIKLIEKIIKSFDQEMLIPMNEFIGEPFLTRYNLHLDSFADPNNREESIRESNLQMDLIFSCGNGQTIFEIAGTLKCDYNYAVEFYRKLFKVGLISYKSLRNMNELQ